MLNHNDKMKGWCEEDKGGGRYTSMSVVVHITTLGLANSFGFLVNLGWVTTNFKDAPYNKVCYPKADPYP